MEERLGRPMRLIRRLRWHQELAAAKIQKWLLLYNAGRLIRSIKRLRACHVLQCNVRMWRSRRLYARQRHIQAAARIQYFWRIELPMRLVPWRRRRLTALTRLQCGLRCCLARRRVTAAHDAANLKEAWRWQAASFAVPIIGDAYRAFRARRAVKQAALLRHTQRHVAVLVTRVVRGHLTRRALVAHKELYLQQRSAEYAIFLQSAWRQHAARGVLRRTLAHLLTRHRFAFHLQAAVRRSTARARYRRLESGDTAAECVQRAWRQRLSRKCTAAHKLQPFLRRAAAAKIAPFFLVRLAERKAGLKTGSICLHCLITVAGGQTSLPCSSQFFAAKSGCVAAANVKDRSHLPPPVPSIFSGHDRDLTHKDSDENLDTLTPAASVHTADGGEGLGGARVAVHASCLPARGSVVMGIVGVAACLPVQQTATDGNRLQPL